MKKRPILMTCMITLLMLYTTISCQEEDKAPAQPYQMTTDIDPEIRAQILSMVEGTEENASGRSNTCCSGITLPSGYDYNNLQQVTISGTNWTTYVAYSTTQNTSTHKQMVGIYYQGSTFKNWSEVKWLHAFNRYTYTYYLPEIDPGNFQEISLHDYEPGEEEWSGRRVRRPGECGDYVAGCIAQWYGGSGWVSVGISFVTLFQPEVGVGVIGGCMLACAMGV